MRKVNSVFEWPVTSLIMERRFCTLPIIARAAIGARNEPRCGQPKIVIIFRGQGQRISAEESAAWHLDVHVSFRAMACVDAAFCEAYASH